MTDDDEQQRCILPHRIDAQRPRRAAEGSQLCAGHIADLGRQLDVLATFDADCDQWMADQALGVSAGGAPVTGSKDKPLVINRLMTEHKMLASVQLASWVLLVAEERQTTVKRVQVRSGNLPVFAQFLTLHNDWAVRQPWAEDYATEVLELGRRAWMLLHPSNHRRFTAPVMICCQVDEVDGSRCPGQNWAFLTPDDPYADAKSSMICDTCGHEVGSGDWMKYGRLVRAVLDREAA